MARIIAMARVAVRHTARMDASREHGLSLLPALVTHCPGKFWSFIGLAVPKPGMFGVVEKRKEAVNLSTSDSWHTSRSQPTGPDVLVGLSHLW